MSCRLLTRQRKIEDDKSSSFARKGGEENGDEVAPPNVVRHIFAPPYEQYCTVSCETLGTSLRLCNLQKANYN